MAGNAAEVYERELVPSVQKFSLAQLHCASPCIDVNSLYTEFPCNRLFRGSPKAIEMSGDTSIFQSNHFEHIDQLCFQQSPGDSPSPKVDVLPNRLREFSADYDIGQIKLTIRP